MIEFETYYVNPPPKTANITKEEVINHPKII